jgi:3'(2'), 5'-bisphosphate nucleotidase
MHSKIFEILLEVQKPIMHYYKKQFKLNFKKDNSPVTEVDLLSDQIIYSALKKLTPNIPIVSEERNEIFDLDKLKDFWLIDPIDGTKGYIMGNDNFAVNIALLENKKPKYGFILLPVTGEIYFNDDSKSYVRSNNGFINEITCRNINNFGIDVVAGSSYGASTKKFLSHYKINSINKVGSSIKFCHIASGKADLYVRYGRTMEWDTAAGEAIIKKAGGNLITIDNNSMLYAKKEFKNNGFLVHGKGFKLV